MAYRTELDLNNEEMRTHKFLVGMYRDGYFPDFLVDRVKAILVRLCWQIECECPATDDALLKLTHAATEQINELHEDFEENDSELETVAREEMAEDFAEIAAAYGFGHIDIEELIAPRDW